MGFNQVIAQYAKALAKQVKRLGRQGRTEFTPNEVRAVRHYRSAAQQLEALNFSDEETSGFDMVATDEGVAIKFEKAGVSNA